MALTYPYPLPFFSDVLRVKSSRVTLQRYDELSGSGDGRHWAAEMARPLWGGEVALADRTAAQARALELKINGLDGSRGSFLFSDPAYAGPQSGVTAGLGGVTVNGIRADRGAIGIADLPVGFVLTAGDRFTITYSTDRVYYGEFLEGGVAGAAGGIGQRDIRPHLPFGAVTASSIILVRPYFKAMIPPNGYNPFTSEPGSIARGGSIRIQQRP